MLALSPIRSGVRRRIKSIFIGFSLATLAGIILGCGGCKGTNAVQGEKKSTLNQNLIAKYRLEEADFPTLQYYLATDLVLSRELNNEDVARPQKGKLVQRKGNTVEEVAITQGTPGICERTETDGTGTHWLYISFEKGTVLKFRRHPNEPSYVVSSTHNGSGVDVTFSETVYKTSESQVNAAHVVVGEESLEKFEKKRRNLEGRKLPQ